MPTTMPTTPILAELANAQKDSFLFGGNQGEDEQLLTRMRAAYALKVAERENFLRFCAENTFDVVLRNAEGCEFALRLSTDTSNAIYGAIHEELVDELRQREVAIIKELLRVEADATLGNTQPIRARDTYESAILALCMPAVTSATTPASQEMPIASLPLPAGQRLFATPPTRPAASAI